MGEVEVDPAERPSRARVTGGKREVFLDWDIALDDAGRLRRCLSCGCTDLFREKAFPPIVAVLVVLNYAGLIAGMFGYADNPLVLAIMIALLILGLVVVIASKWRLVCYRCRSSFYDLPLARYHRSWDRSIADRHPASTPPKPTADRADEVEDTEMLELEEPEVTREGSVV